MNIDQFSKVVSRSDTSTKWFNPLQAAMIRFEINNTKRESAFLAQILYESAYLTRTEESLSYSAPRLLQVFGKYFKSLSIAEKYVGKPQAIANIVYANRMGNGNEETGDGWRYRGRGLIQLTGKANYARCGENLKLDLASNPDLLLDPDNAALSAAWYWESANCNALADIDDYHQICLKINGGTNGLNDRVSLSMKIRKIMTDEVN